jgi:hypothetical protein
MCSATIDLGIDEPLRPTGQRSARHTIGIVGARALALVASACASSAGTTDAAPAPVTSAIALAQEDFAGLVDIGGGRQIWATCSGQGSPTVVLLSGQGNGGADWSLILDPDDPAPSWVKPTDTCGSHSGGPTACWSCGSFSPWSARWS